MSSKREEVWVACPSCGHTNHPGSPFCSRCGARMFDSTSEPPKVVVRTRGGIKTAVRNAVLAFVTVLIVTSVSLVFWPFPQVRTPQVSRSGDSVRTYVSTVSRAVEQGQSIPSFTIREGDWNRFVKESHPEQTRKLSVFMMQDKLVLVAEEQTGPFRIGTRMVLVTPEEGSGLEVEQLWVGHLPLPRFLAGGWSKSLANRYELGLAPEIWDVLRFQGVENGRVLLGPAVGRETP